MLVVVLLLGFQAMAQTKKGKPILPYGDYSIEEVKKFALGGSTKSLEFRKELISLVDRKLDEAGEEIKLTESNISWVFSKVIEQEIWLEAGRFKNSYWLPAEEKIEFYTSESRYEGNAGMFKYGKCSFPLYKVSCGNLLEIPPNKTTQTIDHIIMVPDTIRNTVSIQDTIYHPVWVENPQEREQTRVEVIYVEQNQRYEPCYYQPMMMPVFIPFSFSGYDYGRGSNYSNINIDNNSYYYNNIITNTTNTHVVRNNGGPAGVSGHGAGGPSGTPGFNADHPAGSPGYKTGNFTAVSSQKYASTGSSRISSYSAGRSSSVRTSQSRYAIGSSNTKTSRTNYSTNSSTSSRSSANAGASRRNYSNARSSSQPRYVSPGRSMGSSRMASTRSSGSGYSRGGSSMMRSSGMGSSRGGGYSGGGSRRR